VDALQDAITARADGLPPFRIDYQVMSGVGSGFDPGVSAESAQVKEYLDGIPMVKRESGSVTVNRRLQLVMFERHFAVAWCDLRNGVTKWEMSGELYGGVAGGTIYAGVPMPLRKFHSDAVTPLVFMYWFFPGMKDLGTRLRECMAADRRWGSILSPSKGSWLLRMRTWEDEHLVPDSEDSAGSSEGEIIRQTIWLSPTHGFLPLRRDVLVSNRDTGTPLAVEVAGADGGPVDVKDTLAANHWRTEDYQVLDNVAVLTMDADFSGCVANQWYWVLSCLRSDSGVYYPSDMVVIERRPSANRTTNATYEATRLIVTSFKALGDDALHDWRFATGTYVRDLITDRYYQAGVSPEEYLALARKHVAMVKGYQRMTVELPEVQDAARGAPAAIKESMARTPANEGDGKVAIWLAFGAGAVLVVVAAMALLRGRVKK
jgi:hypothetical protein